MEYVRFPSKLTEEEKALQAKYAELRKKKKALQTVKLQQPEQERSPITKISAEAKQTTRVVKKMVQMGVLPSFAKPNRSDHTAFKRSSTLARKLNAIKNSAYSFQSNSSDREHCPDLDPESKVTNKRKNVYKPSISIHDWEDEDATKPKIPKRDSDTICTGNIKVKGCNISNT